MSRRPRTKQDGVYARVDVQLLGHPKMLRACAEDPGCFELYVRGLLWSKQVETDGVIPFGALQMLGFSGDAIETAHVLMQVHLWDALDEGFAVHDYDRYQITKRERETLSTKRRRAARARWNAVTKRDPTPMHAAQQRAMQVHSKSHANTDTDTDTELKPKNRSRASSTWPTIWSAYTELHPTTKPTEKRRRLLAAREREGYDQAMLLAAIAGNHADPWCSGDNPGGKTYHSFELIFRDAAHVEQYAAIAQNGNGGESRLDRALRRAAEREGAAP